jgi:hypothetical protein
VAGRRDSCRLEHGGRCTTGRRSLRRERPRLLRRDDTVPPRPDPHRRVLLIAAPARRHRALLPRTGEHSDGHQRTPPRKHRNGWPRTYAGMRSKGYRRRGQKHGRTHNGGQLGEEARTQHRRHPHDGKSNAPVSQHLRRSSPFAPLDVDCAGLPGRSSKSLRRSPGSPGQGRG